MSSLKERIELLENDMRAKPPRISVYHDLPFAILRYDPAEEWELRREVRLLATRLEGIGKEVYIIPMSEFLWRAIEETEGLDAIAELERERGYLAAQDQVTTYLSDRDFRPLAQLLAERLNQYDPGKTVAFLTRVAAMAPGIYHMSKLLDLMQGKTRVTTILFYPGSIEGTTGLRFMDLKDRDALGNYRVKIYG
jgi:BREX protein BrxB